MIFEWILDLESESAPLKITDLYPILFQYPDPDQIRISIPRLPRNR